jgi:predicted RNA binding protein YcfA (HicA-like mRNA interferase family)
MADRTIKLRRLRQILKKFGVEENPNRGKGSHTLFIKQTSGGPITYPVPTCHDDILICYVRGCRKKFGLTDDDGVSDQEFYNA